MGLNNPNLDEEYKQAFRTRSYIEIQNKVQHQLQIRTSDLDDDEQPSPSFPIHLSDELIEPRHEMIIPITESCSRHLFLLADYFDISLEAGRICEVLIQNLNQARNNHRAIQNILNLTKQSTNMGSSTNTQHHMIIYRNLASFAVSTNPFSTMTPSKFNRIHESHVFLLHQLTSQCRKTKKRTSSVRRAFSTIVLVTVMALLIITMNNFLSIEAAVAGGGGGLILFYLILSIVRKAKSDRKKWVGEQLDVAARGVYVLRNDFVTMSRVVQRVHDEVEHRKFVADICVRKGKDEMLKEVVKEFQKHDSWFLEQLEELEKQICLCFLDINRSRRKLGQELA